MNRVNEKIENFRRSNKCHENMEYFKYRRGEMLGGRIDGKNGTKRHSRQMYDYASNNKDRSLERNYHREMNDIGDRACEFAAEIVIENFPHACEEFKNICRRLEEHSNEEKLLKLGVLIEYWANLDERAFQWYGMDKKRILGQALFEVRYILAKQNIHRTNYENTFNQRERFSNCFLLDQKKQLPKTYLQNAWKNLVSINDDEIRILLYQISHQLMICYRITPNYHIVKQILRSTRIELGISQNYSSTYFQCVKDYQITSEQVSALVIEYLAAYRIAEGPNIKNIHYRQIIYEYMSYVDKELSRMYHFSVGYQVCENCPRFINQYCEILIIYGKIISKFESLSRKDFQSREISEGFFQIIAKKHVLSTIECILLRQINVQNCYMDGVLQEIQNVLLTFLHFCLKFDLFEGYQAHFLTTSRPMQLGKSQTFRIRKVQQQMRLTNTIRNEIISNTPKEIFSFARYNLQLLQLSKQKMRMICLQMEKI